MSKNVLPQTMIEYLWGCPPGSFDNPQHAAQNLITVFGVNREEAEYAVKFGPELEE